MRLEAPLRMTLARGTLELTFGPQLDAGSGRMGSLECLLRWNDAELGKVGEAERMQTAETAGIARELTWGIFNNALHQSAEFARAGLQCRFSLKLSASGLMQPDFQEFIERALRIRGVPSGRLMIGLHESAVAEALEPVQQVPARRKRMGLRLGIEGFATGASSPGNLARLPLDELKLSARFVPACNARNPMHDW